MKKCRLILLLAACIIVSFLSIFMSGCKKNSDTAAFTSGSGKNSDISNKLDELMKTYNKNCSYKYNGSILVAKGGQILLNKGYGMADYEKTYQTNQILFLQ